MILLSLFPLLAPLANDLKESHDKTLIELTEEKDLQKIIRAEIRTLRTTIRKDTLLIDESLRWQIWNLSETLKNLPPSSPFYEEGVRTLDRALKHYTSLKNTITRSLRRVKDRRLSFDPDYQAIIELAENPEKLASHAESLEKLAGIGRWKKGKARCGPTARGILYHFLTRYGAALKPEALMRQEETTPLLAHLQSPKTSLTLYYIDSDRLDHVFILQETPRGDYCLYQSYVNQYSLEASLASMTPLSPEEAQDFAKALDTLNQERTWSPETATLYESLFHAKPPKSVQESFNKTPPDLRFIPFAYRPSS